MGEEGGVESNDISRNVVKKRLIHILVSFQLSVSEYGLEVLYQEVEFRPCHEHLVLELVESVLDRHDVRDGIVIEPLEILEQLFEGPLHVNRISQVVLVRALGLRKRLEASVQRISYVKTVGQGDLMPQAHSRAILSTILRILVRHFLILKLEGARFRLLVHTADFLLFRPFVFGVELVLDEEGNIPILVALLQQVKLKCVGLILLIQLTTRELLLRHRVNVQLLLLCNMRLVLAYVAMAIATGAGLRTVVRCLRRLVV